MTYEEIAEMLEEMGLPFAYHHYAEGESPAPPFLLFLSPGEETFSADNVAYFSFKQLDVELYTNRKPVSYTHLDVYKRQATSRTKAHFCT